MHQVAHTFKSEFKDEYTIAPDTYNNFSESEATQKIQPRKPGERATHQPLASVSIEIPIISSSTPNLNTRKIACIYCHQMKIRCDRPTSTEPCSRCQKDGRKCGTRQERKRPQKASSPIVQIRVRRSVSKKSGIRVLEPRPGNRSHILTPQNASNSLPLNLADTTFPESGGLDRASQSEVGSSSGAQVAQIQQLDKVTAEPYDSKGEKDSQLSATLSHLLDMIDSGSKISRDELDRYRSIARTVEKGEYEHLVSDLINGNNRNARERKIVYTLTGGGHISGKMELDIPPHQDIDKGWHNIRASIVNLVGYENLVSLPQPGILGYFASKIEQFLNGDCSDEAIITNCPSQNRCVLETLISTLLCRWVFADVVALFADQYGGIVSKIYSLIRATGLCLSIVDARMFANIT